MRLISKDKHYTMSGQEVSMYSDFISIFLKLFLSQKIKCAANHAMHTIFAGISTNWAGILFYICIFNLVTYNFQQS